MNFYLGGRISTDGDTDRDIERRIEVPGSAVHALKAVWSAEDIGIRTKVQVFESLVLNLFLYNSEHGH